MTYRPKYTRKDKNHLDIVHNLRDLGAIVWDLADLGGEVLDILVIWRGEIKIVEIKSEGHESDFTEDEEISIARLKDVGVEPVVALDTEDVLRAFGAID